MRASQGSSSRQTSKPSSKPSANDLRERCLGDIAPLLDAARHMDSLSEVQTKQIRRRIVRTLFRTRFLNFRRRLLPVLVALGMLVIGGAAYAMAERLGLLPRLGAQLGAKSPSGPAMESEHELRKRRVSGARPAIPSPTPGAPEAVPGALSSVPDRLPIPVVPAGTVASGAVPSTAEDVKPQRRRAKSMAYAAPAPVMSAPAPVMSAPREAPGPERSASAPAQPARPAMHSPTSAVVVPLVPGPATSPSAATRPVAMVPVPRTVLGDQALFGQAMRRLRVENNPSAALSALEEHAQVYPRSSFRGERNALEVEALLALHRDRDALARLDTMALDELPRSGERFVVRGELRAAARRWLEASADFDQALGRVSGSPAWHERALWGRGAARLRCGEREAGLADLERYLDKYPSGRFAGQAAKFFPNR